MKAFDFSYISDELLQCFLDTVKEIQDNPEKAFVEVQLEEEEGE